MYMNKIQSSTVVALRAPSALVHLITSGSSFKREVMHGTAMLFVYGIYCSQGTKGNES